MWVFQYIDQGLEELSKEQAANQFRAVALEVLLSAGWRDAVSVEWVDSDE